MHGTALQGRPALAAADAPASAPSPLFAFVPAGDEAEADAAAIGYTISVERRAGERYGELGTWAATDASTADAAVFVPCTLNGAWTCVLDDVLRELASDDARMMSADARANVFDGSVRAFAACVQELRATGGGAVRALDALTTLAALVNATDAYRGHGAPANQLGEALRCETRVRVDASARTVLLTCRDRGGDIDDQDYERDASMLLCIAPGIAG